MSRFEDIFISRKKISELGVIINSVIYSLCLHIIPIMIFCLLFNGYKHYNYTYLVENRPTEILFYLSIYIMFICFVAAIAGGIKGYFSSELSFQNIFYRFKKTNYMESSSIWDAIKFNFMNSNNRNKEKYMWALIRIEGGASYIGNILYIPRVVEEDKNYHIFIQHPSYKGPNERKHEELKDVGGVLLNSSQITSIEMAFMEKDV